MESKLAVASGGTEEYDRLIKILVYGSPGVGKTSLVLRYSHDLFNESSIPTQEENYSHSFVEIREKIVKLLFWDGIMPQGQQSYKKIRRHQGVVLIYDITDQNSLEAVNQFFLIAANNFSSVNACVVGNKSDLHDLRQVDYNTGKQIADCNGAAFCETSCKTGENVESALLLLLPRIFASIAQNSLVKQNFLARQKSETNKEGVLYHLIYFIKFIEKAREFLVQYI